MVPSRFFSLPTGEEYVSEKSLKNLKLYKYSAVDKSFLTKYVLRHYWEWAVTLFPLWMAPNLITLFGLIFELFDIFLILIYMPDLAGPAPSWVYFCFGIGIWLYSTFDNVDGKQARRTKSSSPLGELFDHGIDALNCLIGTIIQAASLGLGITHSTLLLSFLATFVFYFSTWEEYHTGTLYLGYINGPTEFIVIAVICSFISGIYGPQVWHVKANSVFPFFSLLFSPDISLIDGLLRIILFMSIFLSALVSVYHVRSACKQKNVPFAPTLLQIAPFGILAFSIYNWATYSQIILPENHLVLFILTTAFAFGRITTKIILGHLTKSEFPFFTVQMVPLVTGAILSRFGLFSPSFELTYLWCSFFFVFSAYMHWATIVINIFCTYLGIKCFSIPPVHAD
ncbi:hypothetical protein BB560_001288 [Smittium megazygosporum]|uniref:Uncharacterized protein n=1 Tax=Smittium megazygosporum TaxID=133381 RepID=A0A2T9ZI05_9FUNG|nr:hypothetical protein BB560_001288 [Smittium megazygosporum]